MTPAATEHKHFQAKCLPRFAAENATDKYLQACRSPGREWLPGEGVLHGAPSSRLGSSPTHIFSRNRTNRLLKPQNAKLHQNLAGGQKDRPKHEALRVLRASFVTLVSQSFWFWPAGIGRHPDFSKKRASRLLKTLNAHTRQTLAGGHLRTRLCSCPSSPTIPRPLTFRCLPLL